MRYVTYVLTPDRGYFDPGELVFREYGVTLEAIHDIDPLNDGSAVYRYEVDSSRRQIHDSLAEAGGKVIDYQLADAGENVMLQLHYYPSELALELLELHRSYAVLLDFPLEFVDPSTSSLRVVEVGPEEELRELIEATRETVDVTVEQVGDYEPLTNRLFSDLTERQREVLLAALAAGYYETPRRATYEDVACELDCSASAVGRHLRRIESRLVNAIVPDSEVSRRAARGPDAGPDG